jgi:hypothetical protein
MHENIIIKYMNQQRITHQVTGDCRGSRQQLEPTFDYELLYCLNRHSNISIHCWNVPGTFFFFAGGGSDNRRSTAYHIGCHVQPLYTLSYMTFEKNKVGGASLPVNYLPYVKLCTVDPRKSNTIRSKRWFDFRVKWHKPHDAVQCRPHGSSFEFFWVMTNFLHSFLMYLFMPLRVSSSKCSSSGGPNCINTSSGITHSGE